MNDDETELVPMRREDEIKSSPPTDKMPKNAIAVIVCARLLPCSQRALLTR
jgi:hypothetical protein